MTKTKYKALAAFQGHNKGDEFEAELDPFIAKHAIEQGWIEKATKTEKEKKDG